MVIRVGIKVDIKEAATRPQAAEEAIRHQALPARPR